MEASGWSGGNGTYGIRVGLPNRRRYFHNSWAAIDVEIDGRFHRFSLTPGFWSKCPEFRDSGSTVIRDWLQRHQLLAAWKCGRPPRVILESLGGPRFRLLPAPAASTHCAGSAPNHPLQPTGAVFGSFEYPVPLGPGG